MKFILSPCGTSLLTNQASSLGALLRLHANARDPSDAPPEDRQKIQMIIEAAAAKLADADFATVSKLSAELNAISKLYSNSDSNRKQDHHVVLCTDTWLGEAAATLVVDWLCKQGINANLERRKELQTKNLDMFRVALSDLVEWCETTIPGYRQSGYRVIFNLTGGFKSINGFLQALAMVYADETVYVFESETELLRLPRLPLQLSELHAARPHLTVFRRLSNRCAVQETTAGIAETLLWQLGDDIGLSPWGELIWQKTKKDIYKEALHASPSSKIQFTEKFAKGASELPKERLAILNERIDDLMVHLETGGANLRRLDLKKLQGDPCPPSTHEADAWADSDTKRIFGHFDGDVFIIDKIDKALH
ncbi:MAG: putative CRISPR-associated protein [Candidatus Obscuribacterales bacterium]|nr:putative CRISPR-associated protein [Candidatus Obscuribacterales bacterium]